MIIEPDYIRQLISDVERLPQTIPVNVDFYDDGHRQLLLESDSTVFFNDVPKTVAVPTADFFTYYLYRKCRPGRPDYSSFKEISRRWIEGFQEIAYAVNVTQTGIRQRDGTTLERSVSEYLGEAVGLSIAGLAFGLHQADWDKISETNETKTLDYLYSSDGERVIELETKGSSVVDNRNKPPSVSQHKASIKSKKAQSVIRDRSDALLVGTIASFDARPEGTANCWLLDPPTIADADPNQLRILNRLRFIGALVSSISPRSTLAASLLTRLAALQQLDNIQALDKVPLVKGNGEPFEFKESNRNGSQDSFFLNKSNIRGGATSGRIEVVSRNVLLFVGIEEGLIRMSKYQTFKDIATFSFSPRVEPILVDCVLSNSAFKNARLEIPTEELQTKNDGYTRFEAKGYGFFSSSGLVIGVLPLSDAWRLEGKTVKVIE